METIGIIGGGFSGLLSAIHLTEQAQQPLHIYIINKGSDFPKGIAYSTTSPWLSRACHGAASWTRTQSGPSSARAVIASKSRSKAKSGEGRIGESRRGRAGGAIVRVQCSN